MEFYRKSPHYLMLLQVHLLVFICIYTIFNFIEKKQQVICMSIVGLFPSGNVHVQPVWFGLSIQEEGWLNGEREKVHHG